MQRLCQVPIFILALSSTLLVAEQKKDKTAPPTLQWEIKKLHQDNNEGAAVGDINGDGKLDVTAGEFWYPAPGFPQLPVRKILPFGADYMQNNGEYLYDMDGDGDLDIVSGQFTLPVVNWFENPGADHYKNPKGWQVHQFTDTGTSQNEVVFFYDIDGDGTPEWFENSWNKKSPMQIIRLVRDEDGQITPVKHIVSEEGNGHGMGFGDLNGDGKEDIIFHGGWYECPTDGPFSGPWEWHRDFVLPHASCPILVVDLNQDGRNDIIWSDGHNYGLYWHEQLDPQSDGTIVWRQHLIDKKFSQGHCLAWADLDNDGEEELIAGKRYYAHSGKDPGAEDPVTLQYYDWNPDDQTWKKNEISTAPAGEGPGTGLQINVEDVDGNGWKDLVVPGKSGTYILWNLGWTDPS